MSIKTAKRGKLPETNTSLVTPRSAIAVLAATLLTSTAARAADTPDSFHGYWYAEDRSVLEFKPCPKSGELCGYIVFAKEYGTDELNPVDALRKRPICGLLILQLRQFTGGLWRDGFVYDPEEGKSYKAVLRKREGKLFLRGFVGTEVFGETETLTPASDFKTPCKS